MDNDLLMDVLDVLGEVSWNLDGDSFAQMFYGIESMEADRIYMDEKFGRFQSLGIIWAWNSLDGDNRRRAAAALAELVDKRRA
jgi:hypothetical protein|tara:strand:+ start:216 stop:464 length:249 start_codon:yes stop_codon:yes gene_type:complete